MDHEEVTMLQRAFADGFRAAGNKRGFLLLANIPLERADDGKLVEVTLEDVFEVGTVSPGFARRAFGYQPLPDALIKPWAVLRFVCRLRREAQLHARRVVVGPRCRRRPASSAS
jgi:hypothetical protein